MMTILTSQMSLFLLLLLFITTFHKTMCSNHTVVQCNEKDRETLLTFKHGINDSLGRISTWSTKNDCCAWEGVLCDNITNRVTKVDLNSNYLEGEMNLCILELEFLSYLDLSDNKFDVIRIPSIQHNITHSSKLVHLNLSSFNFDNTLHMDNLHWLSPFSTLKYLRLSGIDLHEETNWLQAVNTLPSLLELRLKSCNLNNFPSVEYLNLSSLVTLSLSRNNFTSYIPDGFFNLTKNLTYLYLRGSNIYDIPSSLLNLQKLRCLDLSQNYFMISSSIEYLNLSSLVTLSLSGNNFTSHIPDGFFNLTKDLTYLDLHESNIHGEIPSSLLNLQNLRHLYLSYNQLQGLIPNGIGQLPNIQYLDLSENELQGSIPTTLGNLSSLNWLFIGSNNFSGEISNLTFFKLSSLDSLDLSNSSFVFQFDLDWVPPFQLTYLSLENTNQGPNFPSWIYTQKSLQLLDLSSSGISLVDRNKFSSLIERIPNEIYLSNNSIAEDISNLTLNCSTLLLDHNNFTGGLPNISPMSNRIDLSYNSFSGSIPHSWKNLSELEVLNLWSNRLSGEVLTHLSASKRLLFMNLGENEFFGTIPISLSQNLQVVILRANQFEGTIPQQLFNLSYLFHLDLANNKLSGSLPHCVYNLTQMDTDHMDSWYVTTVVLFTKGQDYVYYVSPNRRTIDLSVNNLFGEVPLELFRLIQVQTLNLSHNNLTGRIPKTIGGMTNMESLDLSNNKFFGEIPQSMALLNFLGVLNLSCNNFDGKIPIGTQLQSFNASSYIGNPKLCGAPLNNCTTKEENPKTAKPSTENEDDDSIKESLYLGMGVGFAAGFWGICGSLFFIRKWRHACFRFIDRVGDKLYVTLIVKLNSFRRN
ncbi:putative non-specific serine/threonine protein kinase [Medicago truncatula]|uniref:LRR receptor-like kinase n=1 Tax=Medicago truncatula TaxID=3880 RepID=G7IZV3_MEDTR|nr:receptor-like protein EIX2 [Medicago truncatula]AES70135.2 LRR receptor-like kinase [Medicago truncatula]RHN66948.1 putative non-specific serine/threonine protein kinase [Medicago truncatula]